MGSQTVPPGEGAWETVGGWDGPSRHLEHPQWELHAVYDDTGQRRFELRNTTTRQVEQIGMPSLYPALDVAHAYITQAAEREGQRR